MVFLFDYHCCLGRRRRSCQWWTRPIKWKWKEAQQRLHLLRRINFFTRPRNRSTNVFSSFSLLCPSIRHTALVTMTQQWLHSHTFYLCLWMFNLTWTIVESDPSIFFLCGRRSRTVESNTNRSSPQAMTSNISSSSSWEVEPPSVFPILPLSPHPPLSGGWPTAPHSYLHGGQLLWYECKMRLPQIGCSCPGSRPLRDYSIITAFIKQCPAERWIKERGRSEQTDQAAPCCLQQEVNRINCSTSRCSEDVTCSPYRGRPQVPGAKCTRLDYILFFLKGLLCLSIRRTITGKSGSCFCF